MCMGVCLHACLHVCVSDAHGCQKRGSDPLGLELKMVVSCHVDVGNCIPVLKGQSVFLKTLSHFSFFLQSYF